MTVRQFRKWYKKKYGEDPTRRTWGDPQIQINVRGAIEQYRLAMQVAKVLKQQSWYEEP